MFLNVLSPLVTTIGKYFNKKQEISKIVKEGEVELAKVEARSKIEVAKARVRAIKEDREINGNLDTIAMRQMDKSWKDEFILLVFTTPIIMAFIPGVADSALRGFEVIASMPNWYITIVIALVIVIYGLRGLASKYLDNKLVKKG